jgi:ribonuclease BN (tRNA processing enzyme)
MPPRPTITFVGTGEAADPELPNTSLLYRGGRAVLLDCGYSVPQAFWRVTRDAELLDAIYITHMHADHTWGLPGLLLWLAECQRRKPLELWGGPGLQAWLDRLLDLAYPGLWSKGASYGLEVVELHPGESRGLGPLTLRNAPSAHSVRNLSLRIEEGGASVCYSGDGAPTDETAALYHGTDLLVHECYANAPLFENHAHIDQILDLAKSAGVGRLALVHLGKFFKDAIAARLVERSDAPPVLVPNPAAEVEVAPA